MKKSVLKIFALALVAVICLCTFPVSIYAEDDGFHLILESDGKSAYIHEYTGTDEDVVIPSHTKSGVPITVIESGAFSGNQSIKSVKVPDTVKVIEQNAFSGCSNLDGKLNIRDATLVQKHLAKIEELKDNQLTLSDFDLNGKVNIKDATSIRKKIANII